MQYGLSVQMHIAAIWLKGLTYHDMGHCCVFFANYMPKCQMSCCPYGPFFLNCPFVNILVFSKHFVSNFYCSVRTFRETNALLFESIYDCGSGFLCWPNDYMISNFEIDCGTHLTIDLTYYTSVNLKYSPVYVSQVLNFQSSSG